MLIGSVMIGVAGIVFVLCGYLIGKKERISLLHDYHYENVAAGDKKAFCTMSGQGVVSIGIGMLATAVLFCITNSAWSFLAFMIGFAAGLALLIHAGRTYNSKRSR